MSWPTGQKRSQLSNYIFLWTMRTYMCVCTRTRVCVHLSDRSTHTCKCICEQHTHVYTYTHAGMESTWMNGHLILIICIHLFEKWPIYGSSILNSGNTYKYAHTSTHMVYSTHICIYLDWLNFWDYPTI